MIDLEALTAILAEVLDDEADPPLYLVGIGEAHPEGGWSGGTAAAGTFRPHLTVIHAGSSPIFNQAIATYDRDWQVSFTVRSFAATHSQLQRLGSAWRARLEAFVAAPELPFGADPYKIIGLMWQSLGPSAADRSTKPTSWSAQDSVSLICGKP